MALRDNRAINDGDVLEREAPRLWHPLRNRNYLLLWSGQSISVLGDQFYFIALAWLTLQLTGSALALGTVLMVAAVPRAVLMLLGGAVSDRFSQRILMLLSDVLRGVLVGALAVLVITSAVQLWQLYVVALIFGAVDAVFYPASSAIVPAVVEEALLTPANALQQGSLQISNLIGPVLAGLLIAFSSRAAGIGLAFAVDAATFFISVLTLALVTIRRSAPSEDDSANNLLRSIAAGLRYVWHDPVLRALLIVIAGIDPVVNGVFGVGLPLLARVHFGGAAALGIMSAGFGAGALAGIVGAGSMAPRHRGLFGAAVIALFATGTILLPLMPSVALATILIAVMGSGTGFINVLLMPWMQTRAEPAMLGRVMSLIMLSSVGLTPLTYAAAGAVAAVNVSLLYLVGGAILLATTLFALLSPVRTID
ncbi:MAG TPA: MFS transporter [Thermomicrobiaceae bacterium]|nr:MFS transporter [Thermomicrobiaceae bacterium]